MENGYTAGLSINLTLAEIIKTIISVYTMRIV